MPVKLASFRDRTLEFHNVADCLNKSSPSSNAPSSSGFASAAKPTPSGAPIQSEFNRRASRIALGISQTSHKLSKLAQLAKRTSVFDDPTAEIQDLTAVIKQDITALNSAVVDLQLLSNSQNGGWSTDNAAHSTAVVDDLKSSLMSTTQQFKNVLTQRTENLKDRESRRQLFSTSASKDSTNPFVRQRPLVSRTSTNSAISPPPWLNGSTSSSQLFPRNKADGESQPLLQQQQNQLQHQQLVPLQDSYMQSRAEALRNIESTIHELSNIFTQLATMVSEQGEVAIRIDENIEDTLVNVDAAQGQLVKYLNSISSSRWLMIKVFFALVVFLMIFLFFVA